VPEVEPSPRDRHRQGGSRNFKKDKVHVLGAGARTFFAAMVVAMAKDCGIRGYRYRGPRRAEPTREVRGEAPVCWPT